MCPSATNPMGRQWGDYMINSTPPQTWKSLTTDEGTQAFITNALIPVVDAIGNHAALSPGSVQRTGRDDIRRLDDTQIDKGLSPEVHE